MAMGFRWCTMEERDTFGPYNAHITIKPDGVVWMERFGEGIREARVESFDRALWFMEMAEVKSAFIEGITSTPQEIGEQVKAHSWAHNGSSKIENLVLILSPEQIVEFNKWFMGFWHL